MSKGPGRIERAIRELFDASPDRAFLTADRVKHCFFRRRSALGDDARPRVEDIAAFRVPGDRLIKLHAATPSSTVAGGPRVRIHLPPPASPVRT
jgi:hypothetical protein